MKEEQYEKIYKRIYDDPKDKQGNEKPNELLGEFKIIYGEWHYAFSLIGISKEDGLPYNIIGDEVSGYYNPEIGGTKCRIIKINLEQGHWS